jgi:hypothetical protein
VNGAVIPPGNVRTVELQKQLRIAADQRVSDRNQISELQEKLGEPGSEGTRKRVPVC